MTKNESQFFPPFAAIQILIFHFKSSPSFWAENGKTVKMKKFKLAKIKFFAEISGILSRLDNNYFENHEM